MTTVQEYSLIVATQYSCRDGFYNRPLFGMLANGGMQVYSPHCSLIVAVQHSRRDYFYNRPLFGMLTNGGVGVQA